MLVRPRKGYALRSAKTGRFCGYWTRNGRAIEHIYPTRRDAVDAQDARLNCGHATEVVRVERRLTGRIKEVHGE